MDKKVLVVMILVALLLIAARVMEPTVFQIDWWTVDGGGGVSSGGSYSLNGTIGQADAGVLSGGQFQLDGGYWGGAFAPYSLNLPIILR